MAIKVVINRHFKKGSSQQALERLTELRHQAMHQPGYISGETWVNHYDPGSITVVSTWHTVQDWIRWQESHQRADSEAHLEDLLEEPTKFEIYNMGASPPE